MPVQGRALVPRDGGQVGAPVPGRLGCLHLAVHRVEHPVEQFLFRGDMPVERHGPGVELTGDAPHADGVRPLGVRDRDRGPDDLRAG
jgi:hypothetical protein